MTRHHFAVEARLNDVTAWETREEKFCKPNAGWLFILIVCYTHNTENMLVFERVILILLRRATHLALLG